MEAAQGAYLDRRFSEAERLYAAAVTKAEAFGAGDARLGLSLNQLAKLYHAQGRYREAEPLYLRALAIYETARGSEHPDVAATLNNLGVLYRMHGQYAEAEPNLRRALAIKEKTSGPDSPDLALTLSNLGTLYYAQGLYDQAEPLYRRALAIRERAFGLEHPDVAKSLKEYALLLMKTGRQRDAWGMLERVKTIQAKGVIKREGAGGNGSVLAKRPRADGGRSTRAVEPSPPAPSEMAPALDEKMEEMLKEAPDDDEADKEGADLTEGK